MDPRSTQVPCIQEFKIFTVLHSDPIAHHAEDAGYKPGTAASSAVGCATNEPRQLLLECFSLKKLIAIQTFLSKIYQQYVLLYTVLYNFKKWTYYV